MACLSESRFGVNCP